MPSYTYDDFISAANQAGLLQEFSQADLDTAQRYPEFGMSILGLKQDIHKATTPEAKLLANEAANQLRSSYGGPAVSETTRQIQEIEAFVEARR